MHCAKAEKSLTKATLLRAKKRLVEMYYRSKVGHLGGSLSALDGMMLVHHEFMTSQDRFVLSKGHSAGALYITLWSLGKLADAELDTFHKDNTILAGHPPAHGLPDVPFATGSLGHGLSLAAGLAMAQRLKRAPGYVYCMTSDGEWQEGSTWEALIFAAHQKLSNLTVLIDLNGLQGFGSTAQVASMDNLQKKLEGFDVLLSVVDGHSLDEMRAAISLKADKPRIIILRTHKGHGVSFMQDKFEWHYLPLSQDQYQQALKEIGEA